MLEHGRRKTNSADLTKAYRLLIGANSKHPRHLSIKNLTHKNESQYGIQKHKVVQGCEII